MTLYGVLQVDIRRATSEHIAGQAHKSCSVPWAGYASTFVMIATMVNGSAFPGTHPLMLDTQLKAASAIL